MSKYTTGEIAKLCNVSVRTVQYYDSCKLLVPSELSEGGRRLYSEDDCKRLQTICFLRELDFSIKNITQLLNEENSEDVILLLIEAREKELNNEISNNLERVKKLKSLKHMINKSNDFSVDSISDMASIMQNKKRLRKIRTILIVSGLIMDAIEIATAIFWAKTGNWIPFAIGMIIVVIVGILISYYYFNNVSYVCPYCYSVFKPTFKQAFWAKHTPKTRKLTCPECKQKSYCVEVADENTK